VDDKVDDMWEREQKKNKKSRGLSLLVSEEPSFESSRGVSPVRQLGRTRTLDAR
jgi:hypothetical protein